MAAEALRLMTDQITCSVCLDHYTDPKVLQCHHVYCKACLEDLCRAKAVITCPICRDETKVPEEGGVSALRPAFHMNELMSMRDSLRRSFIGSIDSSGPNSAMSSLDTTSQPAVAQVTKDEPRPPSSKFMCPRHTKDELQLFCETCEEIICVQCMIRSHNGHICQLAAEVAKKEKAVIPPLLSAVQELIPPIEKALVIVEMRREEVSDLRTSIEGDIHSVFHDLHQMLSAREAKLIGQLDSITQRKLKVLAGEKDSKETVLARISNYARSVQETMDTKSDVEILAEKNMLLQKLKLAKVLYDEDPGLLTVTTEAGMVLSVPPNFASQCKGFCQILTPDSIYPQKCIAEGHPLEMAWIERKNAVTLKVHNLKGESYLEPLLPGTLECSIVYKRNGDLRKCEVVHETKNRYEVIFTPTERGAHVLHIKINDIHVLGSPFSLLVRVPVEKLGRAMTVLTKMIQPWAAVVNQREEVVISECLGCQVSVFGHDGRKIRSYGSDETGKMQFKYPRGIALDEMGNIFMVDSGNNRVLKFSEEGEFLAWGGTKGEGEREFIDPKGLAFNTFNKKLYVCDVHRVQIMNSDLTFAGSFGWLGTAEGQFSNAFCVTCDSKGLVYVGDKDNKNIQVFTGEGEFLRMFFSRGSTSAKLFRRTFWGSGKGDISPVGLAIDAFNLVYVSDNISHRVSVFSSSGMCVAVFGGEGNDAGLFKNPRGIATREGGVVYVCDFGNDRVQVF